MNKTNQKRLLIFLLVVLVIALVAVVGYILLREYQYGVSDDYYDSLRNLGLQKGGWLI